MSSNEKIPVYVPQEEVLISTCLEHPKFNENLVSVFSLIINRREEARGKLKAGQSLKRHQLDYFIENNYVSNATVKVGFKSDDAVAVDFVKLHTEFSLILHKKSALSALNRQFLTEVYGDAINRVASIIRLEKKQVNTTGKPTKSKAKLKTKVKVTEVKQ